MMITHDFSNYSFGKIPCSIVGTAVGWEICFTLYEQIIKINGEQVVDQSEPVELTESKSSGCLVRIKNMYHSCRLFNATDHSTVGKNKKSDSPVRVSVDHLSASRQASAEDKPSGCFGRCLAHINATH